MPNRLIRADQRKWSAWVRRAASSGEDSTMSTEAAVILARNSGVASAAEMSAATLRNISAGVPLGANTPVHDSP